MNSRNWNLCSRGKYFLCNLFLLCSNLPASFNSNDRVFIYLEKVFGKKVVATHTWIQDGWEQGGLYCQRSCLLALLLTLEVAEKACKVWEKNKNKKKATLCHHFHSSGRALMLCTVQPLFSATFLSIMHIILNILSNTLCDHMVHTNSYKVVISSLWNPSCTPQKRTCSTKMAQFPTLETWA